MTSDTIGARPEIRIDGAPLGDAVLTALRNVLLDLDTLSPDACTMTFDDPDRDFLERSRIDLDSKLELLAGAAGEESGPSLFDGVVYSLGSEYDEGGSVVVVVAYDRSHALYTGQHTASYLNVTDSDLAGQLAKEVGLSTGRIDATDVVHDHLSQVNETHFSFLSRRAREVDRILVVSGSELSLVTPSEAAEGPEPGDLESRGALQLVPGANLLSLTTRMTAAEQVAEVEVRGWDVANKQALVAIQPAETRSSQLRETPKDVADQFGGARHVTVDLPLATQAECDAVAAAQAQRIAGAFVHAEGIAVGTPQLVAGAQVSLGNLGGHFDGKVTITRARHTWNRRGYRTEFTASGGHDRSLMGLMRGMHTAQGAGSVAGVTSAIVSNVADETGSGRVKLTFPWLSDDYETDWTRVLQLGAGQDRGLVLLPEVNDEVLVGFEQGDPRRPFVLGGLYNGVDPPALTDSVDQGSGTVAMRAWRSRSGHQVLLADAEGQEKVEIKTMDDKVVLLLDAVSGDLQIDVRGEARITADGNATISAKDISIEASGKGRISAAKGMEISSDGEIAMTGKKIKLN